MGRDCGGHDQRVCGHRVADRRDPQPGVRAPGHAGRAVGHTCAGEVANSLRGVVEQRPTPQRNSARALRSWLERTQWPINHLKRRAKRIGRTFPHSFVARRAPPSRCFEAIRSSSSRAWTGSRTGRRACLRFSILPVAGSAAEPLRTLARLAASRPNAPRDQPRPSRRRHRTDVGSLDLPSAELPARCRDVHETPARLRHPVVRQAQRPESTRTTFPAKLKLSLDLIARPTRMMRSTSSSCSHAASASRSLGRPWPCECRDDDEAIEAGAETLADATESAMSGIRRTR